MRRYTNDRRSKIPFEASGRTTVFRVDIKNQQRLLPICIQRVKDLAIGVLSFEGVSFKGELELGIAFVNDRKIKILNRKFHHQNSATDVLAFPIDEVPPSSGPWVLGEVVVSTDTALEQSKTFGTEVKEEISLYVVHGILHLLGYQDDKPKLREKMWRRQRLILERYDWNALTE